MRSGFQKVFQRAVPGLLLCLLAAPAAGEPDPLPTESSGELTRSARFVDPADGSIMDRQTGLRWQKCTLGQRFLGQLCGGAAVALDWHAARRACGELERDPSAAGLPADGRWRLPTRAELKSLLVERPDGGRPFLNLDFFVGADPLRYWSAAAWTDRGGTSGVLVNFMEGTVYGAAVEEHHHVRCVLRSSRIPSL